MAHAQKPDFVFRRNRRVHLNRQGRQFSRLLAAEVCVSAVVMLDTPSSEVVKGTCYPLHSPVSPSLPLPTSPCSITFQLDACSITFQLDANTITLLRQWVSVSTHPSALFRSEQNAYSLCMRHCSFALCAVPCTNLVCVMSRL